MKTLRFIVLTGCFAAAPFAQEDYSSWGKFKPITINTSETGANIAEVLVDYPLLIRLNASHADVFQQALPGGADLRFRRPHPGGHLSYYIDNWDATAQTAEIWVSVDTIHPGNAAQTINIYWEKPGAPAASNAAAVFDSSRGFVAAWHMGGAAGNRPNSTPGGVPAVPGTTAGGSFTGRSVAGLIGAADSLLGGTSAAGGEYFDVSPMPGFAGGFTFSFWANISSTGSRPWMRFFDFGNGQEADNLFAGREASTSDVLWDVFPGQIIRGLGSLVTGQWKHFTMTVGAIESGDQNFFVDGVSAGASFASFSDVERYASYLGRSNWPDAYFTGKMDEVHVSRVARPAGWAKLSFDTQRPGANLLVFGSTGVPASVAPSVQSAARFMKVTAQGRGYAFSLPAALDADMRLSVLDMHGRTVWSAVMEEGAASLAWNGLAANGRPLARGMYFARLIPAAGAPAAVWESRIPHTR